MKARRVMAFCTGKGAGNLHLQRGGSKRHACLTDQVVNRDEGKSLLEG
jgi:hypothetical protein